MNMAHTALLLLLSFINGDNCYAGQFNLAGSFPIVIGKEFTWTCTMFIPKGQTLNLVKFIRNDVFVGNIGRTSGNCSVTSLDSRYDYKCVTDRVYSLIIPAQNMTKYENNSRWRCEYFGDAKLKSLDALLKIGVLIRNVSLSPNDNPLTITEGKTKNVTCSVNADANPSPIIRWYIGDTEIGVTKETLELTADEIHDGKKLHCQATNNDNSLSRSTFLNILYKPIVAVEPSSSLDVSPGEQLTVGCRVLKSNPRVILQYEWLVLGEDDVVGTESHFTINRVSVNDNKTLQCRARNSVGTSEPASVRINVLLVPARPDFIKSLCCDGYAIVVWVTLTSGFDHQETFVQFTSSTAGGEFSNASTVVNSTLNEIYSVRVLNLSPDTTYTFRVVTVNQYGHVTSNAVSCQVKGKLNEGFLTSSTAVVTFGGLFAVSLAVAFILCLRTRRLQSRDINEKKSPSRSTDERDKGMHDQYEQLTAF
uniref:Uncharacterized protein LOC111127518 n=1 Tax=Crassostrea virginica TaxID=6565 RepID=A0A8B8DKY7_CRAVI|nr:uncharacterized protein LOC111127518 [Crassostrea virginica]